MLKKRILASSMASVMALSSFSVVAFADSAEDVAKKNGEAVTEKELQDYVNSLADFVEVDVYEFGTRQAERIIAAYDHALVVLDDTDSDEKAYTAAYLMLKQLYDDKVQYTAAQLEALVKKFKNTYDTMNILNETDDFTDYRFTESTWDTFSSAWDTADSYKGSDDTRGITDAYIDLEEAENNLEPLDIVKKSEFRRVFMQYQDISENMKKFESWRQGSVSEAPTTGDYSNKEKLKDSNVILTYEKLIDIVYGESDTTVMYTKDGDQKKYDAMNKDDNDNTYQAYWIGDKDLHANGGRLEDLITEQYEKMTNAKGVLETSDPLVYAAYEAADDAVKVFKSWKEDGNRSGSKASAAKLLDTYHNRLVEWARPDVIAAFVGQTPTQAKEGKVEVSLTRSIDGTDVKFTYNPINHTLKADAQLYIRKGADKFIVEKYEDRLSLTASIGTLFSKSDITVLGEGEVNQSVPKNHDILEYINFIAPAKPLSVLDDERTDAIEAFKTVYTAVKNGGSGTTYELKHKGNAATTAASGTDAIADSGNLGTFLATADKDYLTVTLTSEEAKAMTNGAYTGSDPVVLNLLAIDKGITPEERAKVEAHNVAVKKIADARDAYKDYKYTLSDGSTKKTVAELGTDLKTEWEKATVGAKLLEKKPSTSGFDAAQGTIVESTDGSAGTSNATYVAANAANEEITLKKEWVTDYLKITGADVSDDYKFHKLTHKNNDASSKVTSATVGDHNTAFTALKTAIDNLSAAETGLGTAKSTFKGAYDNAVDTTVDTTNGELLINPLAATPEKLSDHKNVRLATEADCGTKGIFVNNVDELSLKITDADVIKEIATIDSVSITATSVEFKKLVTDNSGSDEAPASTSAQAKHNGAIDKLAAAYKAIPAKSTAAEAQPLPKSGDGYVASIEEALKDYNAYKNFVAKDPGSISEAEKIMLGADGKGEFGSGCLADGRAIGSITATSTAEWTLVWRQLLYALRYEFPEAKASTYTITMLRDEIKRAAELIDKTGDSALFSGQPDDPHGKVVEDRENAIDWLKEYSAQRNPKSTDKFTYGDAGEKDLEGAVKSIKGVNDTLEDWYNAFKYSYDDIRQKMFDAAKKIDSGEYGNDVKKALGDVASKLAILAPSDVYVEGDGEDVNSAFSGDRTFQPANRLKTSDDGNYKQNGYEEDLADAIAALDKAIKALEEPAKPEVPGDLTGDENVDMLDVDALVQAVILDSKTDAIYDANGDGSTDMGDVDFVLALVLAKM